MFRSQQAAPCGPQFKAVHIVHTQDEAGLRVLSTLPGGLVDRAICLDHGQVRERGLGGLGGVWANLGESGVVY